MKLWMSVSKFRRGYLEGMGEAEEFRFMQSLS
jgi:hypothetical protein